MSLMNALHHLTDLPVNGIAQRYGIADLPLRLDNAQLPALLLLPMGIGQDGLFRDLGEGLQMAHFSAGAGTFGYTLTDLLLIAPEGQAGGWRQHLAPLVTLVDAYLNAIADDSRLGDHLRQPAHVRADMGIFAYGVGRSPARYLGCAFRHTWKLAL